MGLEATYDTLQDIECGRLPLHGYCKNQQCPSKGIIWRKRGVHPASPVFVAYDRSRKKFKCMWCLRNTSTLDETDQITKLYTRSMVSSDIPA